MSSPRIRRLGSDHRALSEVKKNSNILDFSTFGEPPHAYLVRFRGRGPHKPDPGGPILVREHHEVRIDLGANYPRMMPELRWQTPIFHPNISASGVVCLGGYGTYWVPSLNLDELVEMLWDMVRYQNFDTESPYNREAALWARSQTQFAFPIDNRPLRDRLASGQGDAAEDDGFEILILDDDESSDSPPRRDDGDDILIIE